MAEQIQQGRCEASSSTTCSRLARTTWAGRKKEIELLTQEEIERGERIGHPMPPELARPMATSKWASLLPKKEVAHILRIVEANFFRWDSPVSAVITRAAESYDPNFDTENDQIQP